MFRFCALLVCSFVFAACANAACDNADLAVKNGNYKQAVNYYRMCASKEDAASMYKLASLYAKGLGISAPDERAAKKYYLKAARLGYAPAQMMLGVGLVLDNAAAEDRIEGYKWLLLAAEKPENKWIYPLKNTADSEKSIRYLKQVSGLLSESEKAKAMSAAGIFKQEKIFQIAKLVLDKEDYDNFMAAYKEEGEARAAALDVLKEKYAEYKK